VRFPASSLEKLLIPQKHAFVGELLHRRAVGRDKGDGMPSEKRVVLIVEDEFLIRMNAVDMIQHAGFEVMEAGNADEAISILEARPDIHIVFTDIQMPGSMDGLKLAHFVRHRWPPIQIVAVSGHHAFQDDDLPAGSLFLQKPYSSGQVAAALRQLV
jgi:CheY-like chemotaxis protein